MKTRLQDPVHEYAREDLALRPPGHESRRAQQIIAIRLAALLQSATHARAAQDIAGKRYRAGAGSYLAVLENQRALFQIRQELAEAETASYVHVIALYKALGWGTGQPA